MLTVFFEKNRHFIGILLILAFFLSENKYFRVKPHRIRVSWRGPICLEW